jgi:hypothetical protein
MGIISGGDNKIRIKKKEWLIETKHRHSRRKLKRLTQKEERRKLKEYAYI